MVIILPWIINRKKQEIAFVGLSGKEINSSIEDKTQQHNLPAQLTTFIGRAKETETISQFINERRLVTLTGSGGCGKTHLACEVTAKEVQEYKDGAWLVDLAPLTSNELVAKEITEVLNIPEVANKALFARLAVFSGGFELSAIEEICKNDQLLKENILELLSRLVDRSMVYTVKNPDQSIRYTLLETLRQFAQQVLQTTDEVLYLQPGQTANWFHLKKHPPAFTVFKYFFYNLPSPKKTI